MAGMPVARALCFVGGAALFVALLIEVGPGAVLSSFGELSWRLLVIVGFPFALINAFDTLGWKFAFGDGRVSFWALWWARLAGEAFNATTPTASIGGEPVKAWLIRHHAPLDEGLPSVIVAKTTITIAQALFLLVGIVTAWMILPPGSPFLQAMVMLLVLETLGVGGFVFAQTFGAVGWTGRLLRRFGLFAGQGASDALRHVDSALARFYRERPLRLAGSIACHFIGWALSALETYVILRALGIPVSPATALLIEGFATGVRFASFMVPAHLGALEGGHIAIFVALGLTAPAGLTFGLVRRVREAAWTAAGLIALMVLGTPRADVAEALARHA
jgi:uncharacterized protein (TIRG00374 family)